jgi:hypothetical protein
MRQKGATLLGHKLSPLSPTSGLKKHGVPVEIEKRLLTARKPAKVHPHGDGDSKSRIPSIHHKAFRRVIG